MQVENQHFSITTRPHDVTVSHRSHYLVLNEIVMSVTAYVTDCDRRVSLSEKRPNLC